MHRSTGSFELVLGPLLMAAIGFGLDRWLGTTPWLTVGLAMLGLVGVCVNLYYGYKHEMDEHEANATWKAQPARTTPGEGPR
jgi:F0F1-type ATP synthase assembly protein I